MKTATDQNGNKLFKNVKKQKDGTWAATVWFGHCPATEVRRLGGYPTRAAARAADISDPNGRAGDDDDDEESR